MSLARIKMPSMIDRHEDNIIYFLFIYLTQTTKIHTRPTNYTTTQNNRTNYKKEREKGSENMAQGEKKQ